MLYPNSFKNNRVVAVFQPHRYTRLKGLWDEFLDSFDVLDELYVVDTFSAGDKFDEEYNSKNFAVEIIKKGINAKYIDGSIKEELVYAIRAFSPMYKFLAKITDKIVAEGAE